MITGNVPNLLDLDKILGEKAPRLYARMPRFVLNYIKRKVHIDELNEILTVYADDYGVDFMKSVVDYFGLNLVVEGLDRLDTQKRYVFASNHPLGGLDGICLSAIIGGRFDGKIKYLVNDVLYFIKNLQSIFVPVNKYGAQAKDKALALNAAYASDNQIITFPAGLCSRRVDGEIIDLPWHKSFIQKAVEYQRDIVPVFFDGKNSTFFYKFANFRKWLGIRFNIELFFLPDEMFKNKNQTFTIRFGEPVSWERFTSEKPIQAWTEEIRNGVYALSKTDY